MKTHRNDQANCRREYRQFFLAGKTVDNSRISLGKDKMERIYDDFTLIRKEAVGGPSLFAADTAEEVFRFHRSIPNYHMTDLYSLKQTARRYKVDSILIKDESTRFGLKAFKGLGGSYCMYRILCEKLGLDPLKNDFNTFLREDIRRSCAKIEFVTATDGNHGKGVSWAAKLFGCQAHVYMPKGTVEARRKAIEDAGNAKATVLDLNYDDTVRYAAGLAKEKGWILIQDTSWEGYEEIPKRIIEGYLTMAAEIGRQTKKRPTHIFLQAGVGSMAGGIESCFWERSSSFVTIVEAKEAACIYESVRIDDGMPHSILGDPITIMAGLNCGTPCEIVWPVLRDCSSAYCACDDSVTKRGMKAYAHPIGDDPRIISGESGAVTYGLLLAILEDEELRKIFRIDEDSIILLINTEGDTDPEGYEAVLNEE